jgi:ribosomal protein S18 acetylase RimI-like enzyme
MTTTIIRAACLEDCPGVLALWGRARTVHAVTPDRLTDARRLVTETPGTLLVARVEGEIVGALIAGWDGWRGNLYRLAVHPDRRRAGIARELVRAGEASLHRRGARRITALVPFDDARAGAFWDAVGYPADDEIGRRVRNL